MSISGRQLEILLDLAGNEIGLRQQGMHQRTARGLREFQNFFYVTHARLLYKQAVHIGIDRIGITDPLFHKIMLATGIGVDGDKHLLPIPIKSVNPVEIHIAVRVQDVVG